MKPSVSGPKGSVKNTFAPIKFPPTTSVNIWSPITAVSLGETPNRMQALRKPFGSGFESCPLFYFSKIREHQIAAFQTAV